MLTGLGETGHLACRSPLARLFVDNRRDGSRLLSSSLVITGVGLVRLDHPAGQLVAVLGSMVSIYWWICYRHLQR